MRRHAKATSSGSIARKPSGRGSRLRLAILLATAAAFLLVPTAQALANNMAKVHITGSGSGNVELVNESSSVTCSYVSPGPQTGTCEIEMLTCCSEAYELVNYWAEPAVGSEFGGYSEQVGEVEAGCGTFIPQKYVCELYWEEPLPGPGPAEATVTFNAEGGGEPEQPLTLKINEGSGTVVSNPAGIECTGESGKECEALNSKKTKWSP